MSVVDEQVAAIGEVHEAADKRDSTEARGMTAEKEEVAEVQDAMEPTGLVVVDEAKPITTLGEGDAMEVEGPKTEEGESVGMWPPSSTMDGEVNQPEVSTETEVGAPQAIAMEEEEDVPMPAMPAEEEESLPTADHAQDPPPPLEKNETHSPPPPTRVPEPAVCSPTVVTKEEEAQPIIPPQDVSNVQSVLLSPTGGDTHPEPASPRHPPDRTREQDPHEWLLEHFADEEGSPQHGSRRSSLAPEEPPQTPYFSDASPPPAPATSVVEQLLKSRTPSPVRKPESKRATKRPPSRSQSRSPDPTALLEQELDGIPPDDFPLTAASPRSEAGTDFTLEDLAASATREASADPDVMMGNDLDDELLSLVDDKPRHSHSHHAPSAKASRHEKPTTVKESVARKGVATTAPVQHAPSSTPASSERVVMPPPLAPPAQAKSKTEKSDVKTDSLDTTSASASMKKKDAVAKVRDRFSRWLFAMLIMT